MPSDLSLYFPASPVNVEVFLFSSFLRRTILGGKVWSAPTLPSCWSPVLWYAHLFSKHSTCSDISSVNEEKKKQASRDPFHPSQPPNLYSPLPNIQSWATSLPPDVGYDELVDIRTVVVPWVFDFADGFVRRQSDPDHLSTGRGCRVSNREFDSDEASLWWYAYASAEGGHTTGLSQEVSTAHPLPHAR